MASAQNRPPMGGVDGIVVDASGAPVAGASVFVSAGPCPAPDIAAVTGECGDFMLDLSPGDWVIAVFLPSGFQSEFRVRVASGAWTTTTLQMPGGST